MLHTESSLPGIRLIVMVDKKALYAVASGDDLDAAAFHVLVSDAIDYHSIIRKNHTQSRFRIN